MNELKNFSSNSLIEELIIRGARKEKGNNFEILTDNLNQDKIIRCYKSILILDGLTEK